MPRLVLVSVLALTFLLLPQAGASAVHGSDSPRLSYEERGALDVLTPGGFLVNTFSGNLSLRRTLFSVPGRGLDLHVELAWNADHRRSGGPLGPGWDHSHNLRYVPDGAGNVTIGWGDGRADTFTRTQSGFSSPAGVHLTLSEPSSGQLVLRHKHGILYEFGSATHRKVTAIRDSNGNALTFSYDTAGRLTSVTDPTGRSYGFSYNSSGQVAQITDANLTTARSYTFAYDGSGRLTSITDPLSQAETFTYDLDNLVTATADRRGNAAALAYSTPDWSAHTRLPQTVAKGGSTAAFAYAQATRTTTLTDPRAGLWRYAYDGSGRLTGATDPLGGVTAYERDASRNLTKRTDPNQRAVADPAARKAWTWTYDGRGNVLTATDPAGKTRTLTYDATFSRVLTDQDRNGNTWRYEYDLKGNLVKVTDPLEAAVAEADRKTVRFSYDQRGQVLTRTDRTDRATTHTYDTNGSLASVTDSLGNQTQYVSDAAGRLTQAIDPRSTAQNPIVTRYTYDALDRLVGVTDALNHADGRAYDAQGNLTSFTDRLGKTTTYAYDALDRLVTVTDPALDPEQPLVRNGDLRTYDANGNLAAYRDRRGNTWRQTFDTLHRVISRTNPLVDGQNSLSVWQYEYDANGNLTRHTDARGQATTFVYDVLDRPVSRTSADLTPRVATFTYGFEGELISAAEPPTSHSFTYDALYRPVQYGAGLPTSPPTTTTVTYTYDREGRRLSQSGPGVHTISYEYDGAGRVNGVTDPAGASTVTYDAAGNRTGETRPNGVASQYSYDANGRLLSTAHNGPGGSLLQGFTSTRDAAGRVTQTAVQTPAGVEDLSFGYDALGRVTSETSMTGSVQNYARGTTYDENGNRAGLAVLASGVTSTRSFSYDPADQLIQELEGQDTTLFEHDANGGRTSRRKVLANTAPDAQPPVERYAYDARNRLASWSMHDPVTDQPLFPAVPYTCDVFDGLSRVGSGTAVAVILHNRIINKMTMGSALVGGFVAVPTYMKDIKKSKASEAQAVKKIADGAESYYGQEWPAQKGAGRPASPQGALPGRPLGVFDGAGNLQQAITPAVTPAVRAMTSTPATTYQLARGGTLTVPGARTFSLATKADGFPVARQTYHADGTDRDTFADMPGAVSYWLNSYGFSFRDRSSRLIIPSCDNVIDPNTATTINPGGQAGNSRPFIEVPTEDADPILYTRTGIRSFYVDETGLLLEENLYGGRTIWSADTNAPTFVPR